MGWNALMEHTEPRHSGLQKACSSTPVSWNTSTCLGRTMLPTTKHCSCLGSHTARKRVSQRPVLLLCLQSRGEGADAELKESTTIYAMYLPKPTLLTPPHCQFQLLPRDKGHMEMVIDGSWLDLMVLEAFSNLPDPVLPHIKAASVTPSPDVVPTRRGQARQLAEHREKTHPSLLSNPPDVRNAERKSALKQKAVQQSQAAASWL